MRNRRLVNAVSPFATLLVALCVAQLPAQIQVAEGFRVEPFLQGSPFYGLTGIAVTPAGKIYAVDTGNPSTKNPPVRLFEIDIATRAVSILHSGLPLATPDRVILGDGGVIAGNDLVISDWNSVYTADCCDGSIIRFNPSTKVHSLIATGNPLSKPGNPGDIKFSPGSPFPSGLYVVDPNTGTSQGDVHRITTSLSQVRFADSTTLWGSTSRPHGIDFSSGGAFGSYLYVTDWGFDSIEGKEIWRVNSSGVISLFARSTLLVNPRDPEFGMGGHFGTDLFVLNPDSGTNGNICKVDSTGNVSVFASNLPANPTDAGQGAKGDMVFDQAREALYFAYADMIYRISPITGQEGIDITGIVQQPDGQVVITFDLEPHLPPPASGYSVKVLAMATNQTCEDLASEPDTSFDDVTSFVRGDVTMSPDGGLGQVVWEISALPPGELRDKYYRANVSILFRLKADPVNE